MDIEKRQRLIDSLLKSVGKLTWFIPLNVDNIWVAYIPASEILLAFIPTVNNANIALLNIKSPKLGRGELRGVLLNKIELNDDTTNEILIQIQARIQQLIDSELERALQEIDKMNNSTHE